MTNPQPQPDQGNAPVEAPAARDEARRWLDDAAGQLVRVPTMDLGARAAVMAQLGTGYAVLAAVEARAPKPVGLGLVLPEGSDPALFEALTARAQRSEVEARPHDDEGPGEPEGDGGLPLAVDGSPAAASKPARRKPAAKAGEALRG